MEPAQVFDYLVRDFARGGRRGGGVNNLVEKAMELGRL